MTTAIGYLRVSTDEQADSRLGLDAQRAAIAAYASAHGWEVEWFADEGRSGKSLDRPALQAALTRLDRREAQVLIVSKLDRLSRSVADFAGLLEVAQKRKWRTSAALRAAQARGVHVGRPRQLSKDAEARLYELRALGMSHARVAEQLNTERVPTAHGGKAWHATTVARILKRNTRETAA